MHGGAGRERSVEVLLSVCEAPYCSTQEDQRSENDSFMAVAGTWAKYGYRQFRCLCCLCSCLLLSVVFVLRVSRGSPLS